MSAPKRYEPNSSTFVVMLCRDHGEYVLYSDYAALAAEVERLKEAWVDKKMEQDRDALLAENERLRNAALAAELERIRSEHEVGFSSVVLKKWAAEHAALAAENANLKALQWETLKERNKAEAENERLRKAGDDLYFICQVLAKDKSESARKAWYNAKKEGRDAK